MDVKDFVERKLDKLPVCKMKKPVKKHVVFDNMIRVLNYDQSKEKRFSYHEEDGYVKVTLKCCIHYMKIDKNSALGFGNALQISVVEGRAISIVICCNDIYYAMHSSDLKGLTLEEALSKAIDYIQAREDKVIDRLETNMARIKEDIVRVKKLKHGLERLRKMKL